MRQLKCTLCLFFVATSVLLSAAERPNIVFFLTDDIRYDFFGYRASGRSDTQH